MAVHYSFPSPLLRWLAGLFVQRVYRDIWLNDFGFVGGHFLRVWALSIQVGTAINQRYWFWRVSCCHVGLIWIGHTVHLNTVVSQAAGSVCCIKKGFNRHFVPQTSVCWNCFDAFIRLCSSDLVLMMLCDMHDNIINQSEITCQTCQCVCSSGLSEWRKLSFWYFSHHVMKCIWLTLTDML